MAPTLHLRLHPGYLHPVDVPKTLRVSGPQPFSGWIRRLGSVAAEPVEGLEGEWVRVKGAPLPVTVLARIDRTHDGRFIVTGLLIGHHDRREITWETLREIRPASIVSMIFAGFDPRRPAKLVTETDPTPEATNIVTEPDFDARAWREGDDPGDEPTVDLGSAAWRRHSRALIALELWRRTAQVAHEEVREVTRPRASVATNLTEFAETYEKNRAIDARRATTATANDLHISRATAIRRIAECREAGLLPQGTTGGKP